jgi:hypothetical protein
MHLEKRFVFVQLAEKIRTHAHQRVQTRIGNALRDHLRKTAALALLGAHVQLLALVDIEEKGGGLGPIQFLVTALGGVKQIAQHGLAVPQQLDPVILQLDPLGIGRAKLPSVEKRFDQRLERLGPGLEREEAPAAAFPKGMRPLGLFPSLRATQNKRSKTDERVCRQRAHDEIGSGRSRRRLPMLPTPNFDA